MLTEKKNKYLGHDTDTIAVQHWMGGEGITNKSPVIFKTLKGYTNFYQKSRKCLNHFAHDCRMYADDTNVSISGKCIRDHEVHLNHDSDEVHS